MTFEPGLVPTTQTVSLPGASVSKGFGGVVAVSLRAGAPDDLLLSVNGSVVLVRRGGDGRFTPVQQLRGGVQSPIGAGALDRAKPPYVLTTGAGLFAGDRGTEVVPVPTKAGLLE